MSSSADKDASGRNFKYYLVSFVDLLGVQRAKFIPAEAIASCLSHGVGFAGSSTWFDIGPAAEDLVAIPDADGLTQLPWNSEVAWLPSDLRFGAQSFEQGPRCALKRVIAQGLGDGYVMKSGVEPEFFLLSALAWKPADQSDKQAKPGYDQQALMRRCDLVAEICDAMTALGWRPYQGDHEDANGQFELNWHYADALVTADRHAFFKFMTRSIAEKHGFRATFMPKPFPDLTGSGCHVHVSLWRDGQNLFLDPSDELGLSRCGYHFIGGLLHSANALAAFSNSTVNSYKRINAARTASGPSYAPSTASYSGNNRTHMIRIPSAGRIEFRLPDGGSNPYLLQAAVLAAGLDGVRHRRDPGTRCDLDLHAAGHQQGRTGPLPENLLDALRNLEGSAVLRDALGDVIPAYLNLKHEEWRLYCSHLTQWERDRYLDC